MEKQIPVFKPLIVPEAKEAVSRALGSGWIGLGPKTAEFEKAFAEYLGVDPYNCVAMNSCTAALHVALDLCVRINPGDEVITTPNTFVSTNHAILYAGATPVFCDISLDGNINAEKIEQHITDKTRAIMAVHFGGYPCDIDKIRRIAYEHDLYFIEDCAHACGSTYKGKKVGTFGEFGCFSFQAVKNLPVGDGGMLVCKSDVAAQFARELRWLGIDKDTVSREKTASGNGYAWQYSVPRVGYKYHMNDISAAIGIEQLKYLDEHNARRRKIAEMYRAGLQGVDGVVHLPVYDDDRISATHFYPIIVDKREKLILKLKDNNIHPGVHYWPNHKYEAYRDAWMAYHRWHVLDVAAMWGDGEITLPMHLYLTDDDVNKIIEVLRDGWY